MNYLKDYREGEKFVGTYLCKQKQILKTKAGKTYYSRVIVMSLAIKSGEFRSERCVTFSSSALTEYQ